MSNNRAQASTISAASPTMRCWCSGLLPEFSQDVPAEAERIDAAASKSSSEIRDLRHLLWRSIDNDDSRDLDQLSVAEALTGGRSRSSSPSPTSTRWSKQDSAIDDHARTNTTSVYTAGADLPDAAGEALDRPHLARTRARSGWRSSSR